LLPLFEKCESGSMMSSGKLPFSANSHPVTDDFLR